MVRCPLLNCAFVIMLRERLFTARVVCTAAVCKIPLQVRPALLLCTNFHCLRSLHCSMCEVLLPMGPAVLLCASFHCLGPAVQLCAKLCCRCDLQCCCVQAFTAYVVCTAAMCEVLLPVWPAVLLCASFHCLGPAVQLWANLQCNLMQLCAT